MVSSMYGSQISMCVNVNSDVRTLDGSSWCDDDDDGVLSDDESLLFDFEGASDVAAACCVETVAYRISLA